jgi:hypothetical protein
MAAPTLFISYRRDDAHGAGLLRSEIARRVGASRVFMDTRSIAPGQDFASEIFSEVSQSDVVLAVIGPAWIEEEARLGSKEDWVRQELVTASGSGARVVPVLLGGVQMPSPDDLPEALQSLPGLHAYSIGDDHIDRDVNDLLAALSIRKSRRTGIAVGALLVSAVAAVVIAWAIAPPDDGPYYNNTELIFDTSAAMATQISSDDGSQTIEKLALARDQVGDYVERRAGDNLALRTSAGCGMGGELVVPFRTGATGAITDSLAGIVPMGATFGLADAVIAATGDFNDSERFPPETQRQIIVFTAGGDGCMEDPAGLLAERWQELGDLRLAVEFIGMGLNDADQEAQLEAMASAVDGRAFTVDSQEELDRLLAQLLDVEPVLRALDEIVATGNDIVNPLQDLRRAHSACDVASARAASVASEEALSAVDPALRSLQNRDDRPSYLAVHAAAILWADSLADVNDAGESITDLLADRVREGPAEGSCDEFRTSEDWDEAIGRWNDTVELANGNLRTMREERDRLVEELDELLNS